MSFYMTINIYY